MENVIIVVLGIVMIASAFMAIYMKSLLSSIITGGVISLLASVIYLLLAAPDVAMTEAAIGSGLTTVVFLYAFSKVRNNREEDNG